MAATPATHLLATLERTRCYGTCPAYRVEVFSDGRTVWEGRHQVARMGRNEFFLDAAQLAALRGAFIDAGYFELTERFECYERQHQPTVVTSFTEATRHHEVTHYAGCASKPGVEMLLRLEAKFDLIVGSAKLIGESSAGE